MSLTNYLVLDVSSAPMVDAASYVEEPSAPANYKDPLKIAEYVAQAKQKAIDSAALDVDTAVVTGMGLYGPEMDEPCVWSAQDEKGERRIMASILDWAGESSALITFNGHRFDLPLILRRCLYLGIDAPDWNLDRYKSPHIDLWQKLSLNGQIGAHSLSWYAKRFGWTDVQKPLTGAEEAQVMTNGRWDDLRASVLHDVTVTHRLAQKMRLIP